MALKSILVVGATGKQGGALVKSIFSAPQLQQFNVIALTRSATSPSAQRLAKNPNITVLEGDLNNSPAIFSKITPPLWGVFAVTMPMNAKVEEQQGKALVDAAAAHGVQHFVFASVERGGPELSDVNGTVVPHFKSKFNIENHLKEVAPKHKMQWTIIRPVAFMENVSPDFIGRAFAAMWKQNGLHRKLQLVSAADIGKLAAVVFRSPEDFQGKALSFAGDEVTWQEANDIFKGFTGRDMPLTYGWLASVLKWILHEQLGIMLKWFVDVGFGADPNEYRGKVEGLLSFEQWLKNESGFKDQKKSF